MNNNGIHTTNIVGAWVPVEEGYDFENDFDAPKKLFWCKGPYGEGHWTNDELWEDLPRDYLVSDVKVAWFRWPELIKITHWAWVEGPSDSIKENNGIVDLRSDKAIWDHVQKICEERLKVGEPKE